MKTNFCRPVFSLFLMCVLIISIASSATITFQPADATISPGATTNFTLILDSAPKGIAGYNLNVVLSNPGISEFVDVSYPAWATLNNVTYPSPGVARLSGVDIGRVIQPGSDNIALGTVTIRGTGAGSTDISINSIRMDAQGGASMNATAGTSRLAIQGGTSSGGNGYAGGGGGGGYASGRSGQSYTGSSPTTTENTPVLQETTGATQTIITPSKTQGDTAITQVPTTLVTTPVTTPLPLPSATKVPVITGPGNSHAPVPWTTIIGILIVIGIIGAALVLYFVKKAKLI